MQNREKVPLFPLGTVINRGKSFASNVPQVDSCLLCPLAVLGHPPELSLSPWSIQHHGCSALLGLNPPATQSQNRWKNSTSGSDNGFKDAGEMRNENSSLFRSDSEWLEREAGCKSCSWRFLLL